MPVVVNRSSRKKRLAVLVLAGGDSAERDVSLDSARGMAEAAREAGHRVLVADPARPQIAPTEDWAPVFGSARIGEMPPDVIEDVHTARAQFVRTLADLETFGIDIVLNGLHGGVGEDGTIQAVMDFVGVPYTGSGAEACALAMDKYRSKHIAQSVGVPVAKSVYLDRSNPAANSVEQTVRDSLSLPVVVKPNNQGSSVGLTVVPQLEYLEDAVEKAFRLDDHIIVEEYVAGVEITAAVLEGEELPLLEIRPKSGLYDYYHKYQAGASEYLVPAPLDDAVAAAIAESARRAFTTLGCRVYGRADFRLGEDGRHFFLEVNTLPGMTSTSLVPKAAKKVGIDYTELVDRILRLSLAK
jgi:D-alanine-D-alanine ligase